MKTIFITIYGGDMEKKLLHSGVIEKISSSGARIVLLVKEKKEKFAPYQTDKIFIEQLPSANCFSERLYSWIGWNILPTKSASMRRYETYLKTKDLKRYWAGLVLGQLGKIRLCREVTRLIYWIIPDSYGADLFSTYQPDVVFAPSMFSFEDGRLLKAAKKRKIPTVSLVKSWDVLTNKAFTRVRADKLLAQNAAIRNVAIKLGDYQPTCVEVVGFVEFDFVAHPELLVSREDFFRTVGADPAKKLILYATSGDWKNPYDAEVIEGLHTAIEQGRIPNAQILARFHPKFASKIERLNLPFLIKDRPGTHQGEEASLEVLAREYKYSFTQKDIAHLANTLYHSDVTINTMSTITLDAVAFDRPVVLICHDGLDRKLDYWHSLRRTYEEDHYQVIMKIPCAQASYSMAETVDAVQAYLTNPARDAKGRKHLRDEYLFKLDGRSGERIAAAVTGML